jgi:hypothetical protein
MASLTYGKSNPYGRRFLSSPSLKSPGQQWPGLAITFSYTGFFIGLAKHYRRRKPAPRPPAGNTPKHQYSRPPAAINIAPERQSGANPTLRAPRTGSGDLKEWGKEGTRHGQPGSCESMRLNALRKPRMASWLEGLTTRFVQNRTVTGFVGDVGPWVGC